MWRKESGFNVPKSEGREKKRIRLDVPFLPDLEYIHFLNHHAERMES